MHIIGTKDYPWIPGTQTASATLQRHHEDKSDQNKFIQNRRDCQTIEK